MLVLVLLGSFLSIAGYSSANIFEDIATNLALKLDVTEGMAGVILGTGVLVAVGFALAKLELDSLGIAIVLLAIIGMLVIVGWLYVWLLIIAALLVAIMVADKIRKPYGGAG